MIGTTIVIDDVDFSKIHFVGVCNDINKSVRLGHRLSSLYIPSFTGYHTKSQCSYLNSVKFRESFKIDSFFLINHYLVLYPMDLFTILHLSHSFVSYFLCLSPGNL